METEMTDTCLKYILFKTLRALKCGSKVKNVAVIIVKLIRIPLIFTLVPVSNHSKFHACATYQPNCRTL